MYDVRKSLSLESIWNVECRSESGMHQEWGRPMRELEKPVGRVFRRLRFQRFVTTLVWSWAISLFIVATLIGAEKLLNQAVYA